MNEPIGTCVSCKKSGKVLNENGQCPKCARCNEIILAVHTQQCIDKIIYGTTDIDRIRALEGQ